MSYYEWISTIHSFLSLFATIFFSLQVYKLSKQANDIAKESLMIQKQQLEHHLNIKNMDAENGSNNNESEKINKIDNHLDEVNKNVLKLISINSQKTKKIIK